MARLSMLIVFCLSLTIAPVSSSPALVKNALIFSDLHIDPYYGTQFAFGNCTSGTSRLGQYGCDSPPELFHYALKAARTLLPQPSFIVVTGDFVRHLADAMPRKSVDILDTLGIVTSAIEREYPEVVERGLFLPVLGNNDMEHNYQLNDTLGLSNPYLSAVADVLGNVLVGRARSTFSQGGFYSKSMGGGLLAVVLNTVPYSPFGLVQSDPARSDPFGQFEWLEATLQLAKEQNDTVYIFGHIPPGIDTYSQKLMWVEAYAVKYWALVEVYHDVIGCQVFGHLHDDEFHVFHGPKNMGKSNTYFVTSALSPVYSNNPSFRVLSYAAQSLQPVEYHVVAYGMNGPDTDDRKWSLAYNARDFYGLQSLDNTSLEKLAHSFFTDNVAWDKFSKAYKTWGVPEACAGLCRVKRVCALLSLRLDDHTLCVQTMTRAANTTADSTHM